MKTTLIFFTLFLFTVSFLNAQNDTILFQPESGKQYIYDFTESTYILTDDNIKLDRFVIKKTFKIEFDTFQPENKEYLKVSIIKNSVEKPDAKPFEINDYRFPYLQEGFPENSFPDFTEVLLSRLTFKFSLNYNTSIIELLNKEEILQEARIILTEKGFKPRIVDNRIQDFINNILPKTNAQIQQIFQTSKISNSKKEYDTEVSDVSIQNQNSYTQISQIKQITEPGIYSKQITYNTNHHYLEHYKSIKIDTLKYPFRLEKEQYNFQHIEKNIALRSIKDIPQNKLIISGKIENTQHKKVTLAILRDPFGTNLSEESVFLDENNSFKIETELKHPQLVYLQFGSKNFVDNLPMLAFYAEPDNQIHFEAAGNSFPWEIEFSGDQKEASTFLYDLRNEYDIFYQRLNWYTIQNKFSNINYTDFMSALYNFEKYASSYKEKIQEYVFKFITNEIKAFLNNETINILNQFDLHQNIPLSSSFFRGKEAISIPFLHEILDSLNITDIYNEYGIHSRQLAANYMNYHYQKNIITRNIRFSDYTTRTIIRSYNYYGDLPHFVEIAKNTLAAHPLYSVLADMFVQTKMNISNQPLWFEQYTQNETNKYLDLITRVCNDNECINELRKMVNNHKNWENEKYVPSTKLYNPQGEPVYMNDFLGKKPTIFYVTNDWSTERYFWDELAQENKEINFVLIMEGSNIEEWKDYVEKATPTANQLFLVNNELNLKNIFKSNYQHFIIYDQNGIRIGFFNNAISAKNLAKKSLNNAANKHLNKSQLKLIIIVLLVILSTLIISLLIWKWRVRQRFRKEEQKRRLRELELTAIRSQMNPHFLFNSLNSVQNLVQQKKGREAHLYLADFAGLIRKVLQNSEKEEIALAEELEMTKQYLTLEKLRFSFEFTISVANEIDVNNTMVPSMLIQPFAENAIIHGLQNKPNNKLLKINVTSEKSGIKITIEDNGIGRKAAKEISKQKNGKSSKLIKERLEIMQQKQGEKYHMKIIDLTNNKTGTRVEIYIPEEN